MVQGSRSRVQGSGLTAQGSGLRVRGSRFGIQRVKRVRRDVAVGAGVARDMVRWV